MDFHGQRTLPFSEKTAPDSSDKNIPSAGLKKPLSSHGNDTITRKRAQSATLAATLHFWGAPGHAPAWKGCRERGRGLQAGSTAGRDPLTRISPEFQDRLLGSSIGFFCYLAKCSSSGGDSTVVHFLAQPPDVSFYFLILQGKWKINRPAVSETAISFLTFYPVPLSNDTDASAP
ncbi:hypothetical protein [Aquisalimonas asiatica]|uniref:hypothetical protein n=1 Tax=Aquisalimonas asiatica TaxID=406100 RepID=UPI0011136119|nr:hypothetical protein [Aquisalimonas asiatica]